MEVYIEKKELKEVLDMFEYKEIERIVKIGNKYMVVIKEVKK